MKQSFAAGQRSFVAGMAVMAGLVVAAGAAAWIWLPNGAAAETGTYRQLNLFGDVFERVRSGYVEETQDAELIHAALNGMLTSLDPHSAYLDMEEFEDMQEQTKGEFGGLGIQVTMEDGVIKVISPIDDTPAQQAGILPNDLITHLDGEPIRGMTLNEAVEEMRGEPGTAITLTVVRGDGKPREIKIVRAVIRIHSVKYERDGGIGYIRISAFTEKTTASLQEAVAELEKETETDLIGYVVDLRNNPGGLLDQAVNVSDTFLDQGEIVSTRGRQKEDTERYSARRGDAAGGKPVIILINGGSASASEIVAGALQDHRRATILGTRSFGKGSVQTIVPLGADGAMRLTTALYYMPSGRSIQARGVEPDIEVEQIYPEEEDLLSATTSEADLRGHLEAGADAAGADEDEDGDEGGDGDENEDEPKDAAKAARSGSPAYVPADKEDDAQLNYAYDLLRDMSANVSGAAAGGAHHAAH